jgi:hypothetical protein
MAKRTIADVTNLQTQFDYSRPWRPRTSPQYVETVTHRRFYQNHGLYLAVLYGSAMLWDSGKPEWQRKQTSHFQYGAPYDRRD